MPKYKVCWHETVWRDATVEAEDKDAAWWLVLQGDVMAEPDPVWEELESELDSVEELKEDDDA